MEFTKELNMCTQHFLCNTHRTQLSNNLIKAVECFFVNMKTANALYQSGRYNEAFPHAGCAVETAKLILKVENIDTANALLYFTQAIILTAQIQEKRLQLSGAHQLIHQAILRLKHNIHVAPGTLSVCLEELYSTQIQLPGNPARHDTGISKHPHLHAVH